MVKKVEKKEKKKAPFLVIVAIALYIFALVFLSLGIIRFRDYMSGNTTGLLSQSIDAHFEINFMNFHFSFDGLTMAINYFVDAAVFFIWGTVLVIISGAFKKKVKKPTEEEFLLDEEVVGNNERFLPNEKLYCAYCDTELGMNDRKCPNCGAAKKIKK